MAIVELVSGGKSSLDLRSKFIQAVTQSREINGRYWVAAVVINVHPDLDRLPGPPQDPEIAMRDLSVAVIQPVEQPVNPVRREARRLTARAEG